MKIPTFILAIIVVACSISFAHGEEATAAAPPEEQLSIRLKPEAFVKGDKVTLKDIADFTGTIEPSLAEMEIVPSALPGATKRIEAALVESRLRDAGFSSPVMDPKGARSVAAKTLHLELSRDAIAEELRRFIEVNMPWDPADTTIDVLPPAYDVVVPDGNVSFEWKSNPQYRYVGTAGFRGEISINGAVKKTVLCRATIETYQDVVVATENIPGGTKIALSSLALEKRPMSKLESGSYTTLEDVVGLNTRSTIFAGTPIVKQRVIPPKLIKRNQSVTIEARDGTVTVRTQAKALSDAAAGDTVSLMNPESKEKFVGVVRPDGAIIIE